MTIAAPELLRQLACDERLSGEKRAAVRELIQAARALADVLEHDCDCPPCEGSMAPGEHWLGVARRLLGPGDRPAAGGAA